MSRSVTPAQAGVPIEDISITLDCGLRRNDELIAMKIEPLLQSIGGKMKNYQMWVGGQWIAADSGDTFTAINPATEEPIARIPKGGPAEVDRAVAAARQAFPVWSAKPVGERSRILLKIADEMRKRLDELIQIHVLDHGSPQQVARLFALSVPEHFQYAAEMSKTIMGVEGIRPAPPHGLNYVSREPYGVCAGIIPWNIPFMITAKIAAALATGNTCIIKPPSAVSLPALKIAEIMAEQDLPPGAVNIITGPGGTMGEALASHRGVDMVAFTGSHETGQAIMAAASRTVKPVFLELGGKNPFIVLADADVDKAVARAVSSSFFNSGMVCGSTGRFYVHETIYDEFVNKFVAGAKKMTVGDPMDPMIQMGPVVSAEHRDRVETYIRIGKEEGARLVMGGQRPSEPPFDRGYYVMPTVFTHVGQQMRIAREEIFGPVACIMEPFSVEEEVIDLANDNPFGLTATVWTQNTAKGIRFANKIDAGNVRVNGGAASFGSELPWGGFKGSGFGKEGSRYGLEIYTRLKLIGVDTSV